MLVDVSEGYPRAEFVGDRMKYLIREQEKGKNM